MQKNKLKQFKHQQKKKEYLEKCKERTREMHDKIVNDQMHSGEHEGTTLLSLVPYKLARNDAAINRNRRMIIRYLFSREESEPRARNVLADMGGDPFIVSGYVADVKAVDDHAYLLIDYPVMKAWNDLTGKEYYRQIDTHVWVSVDDIIFRRSSSTTHTPPISAHQTIAIGDFIRLVAVSNNYWGHTIDHLKGYRWGIGKCKLLDVGACYEISRKSHGEYRINSRYDRQGDWVIKFNNLPSESEAVAAARAQGLNENEQIDLIEGLNRGYEIKPSRYPSYAERLQLNDKNKKAKKKAKKKGKKKNVQKQK